MDMDFQPRRSGRQPTYKRRFVAAQHAEHRPSAAPKVSRVAARPASSSNASVGASLVPDSSHLQSINRIWKGFLRTIFVFPRVSGFLKHMRRKLLQLRLMWIAAVTVVALLLVVLPVLWPQASTGRPSQQVLGSNATLKASKKIFAVSEDPSFRLDFPKQKVGWLAMPSMVGQAAAAESIRTAVYYDNGQRVDMPIKVVPDGNSSFDVQLAPTGTIKPGRYSVTAEWGSGLNKHTATQNFAWGVLALNTSQASYAPHDTAVLSMAVLSSTGKTLCDAPLKLTITAPDGRTASPTIQRPADCHPDAYTDVADYSARYVVGDVGTYRMKLQLADTDYSMNDTFTVVAHSAYTVERSGPTRLFPPAPYTMKLRVTAHKDFYGTVSEGLPTGFTVENTGGAVQSDSENKPVLRWQVSWRAGETHELVYSFKAPKVSPAFYTFQPLTLRAGNHIVYQEQRRWQMAGDAVITLVQEASADLASTTSTGHIAFSSTAGDTLILNLAQTANNQGISAITDSAGNTWTYPATGDSQNPPAAYMGTVNNQFAMAYVVNAAAVSWIQIDIPAANKMTYDITEFSNIASTSAVDQSAAVGQKAPGGTTAPYYQSTPTITTTNANDLIIGGMNPTGTNTFSDYGAGYTALAAGKALGAAYQVVNATGSYTITIGVSASKSAGTGIMAFKAASGGGGGSSCTVAAPSIAFVQQAEQNSGANTTSITTSFPSTSTAGNLLVALVSVYGGLANAGAAISSVTGGGNSWTYPTADPQDNPFAQAASGSNSYIAVAYAANASATSSVTVNLSVNLPVAVVIAEFSGVATSSPVDISKGQVGAASTTPTTPTITTTNANDLIIGAVSETTTPALTRTTSGYTDFPLMTANNDPFDGGSAWQVVSATGNYSVAWSAPGNHAYGSGIIAFKQATGSSAPSMDLMMRGGNYFCNGVEQGFFWAS